MDTLASTLAELLLDRVRLLCMIASLLGLSIRLNVSEALSVLLCLLLSKLLGLVLNVKGVMQALESRLVL